MKAKTHMNCRTELKRIQSQRDYPSISLLAPTHRTAPANKRDRIVEKVIGCGGDVFFYEPGVLDLHQQIAAVLRY
jgi:hypothetical protein